MKLLSFSELKTLKGIPYTRVHVYRLEKQNEFPPRVHISANRVGWLETEIDAWIAKRAEQRAYN